MGADLLTNYFAEICDQTVEYAIGTPTVGPSGATSNTYPNPGSGTSLKASVQPKALKAIGPDGVLFTRTIYRVFLLLDPTTLNSGAGVQLYDGFRWHGLLLVAQGPAKIILESDLNIWEVDCLLAE